MADGAGDGASAAAPVEFNGTTYKALADGKYDYIILGTGLKECILSGLLSIDGKKVRARPRHARARLRVCARTRANARPPRARRAPRCSTLTATITTAATARR